MITDFQRSGMVIDCPDNPLKIYLAISGFSSTEALYKITLLQFVGI